MNSEPKWIPTRAVVDLHAQQIEEYGGLAGVQDHGKLESALARPKQIFTYGGEDVDIPVLAAAYAWGIGKNHPFVDGNKRMSLIAIYVFLGLNGFYLDAREEDAYQTMMLLASGAITEEQLIKWVRENSLPTNSA